MEEGEGLGTRLLYAQRVLHFSGAIRSVSVEKVSRLPGVDTEHARRKRANFKLLELRPDRKYRNGNNSAVLCGSRGTERIAIPRRSVTIDHAPLLLPISSFHPLFSTVYLYLMIYFKSVFWK